MSPDPAKQDPTRKLTAEEREARRRRLDEVFGDVLPEQTGDDAAEPDSRPDGTEEWLRRQVPPHHG
jgi:hypothetical protein